MRIIYIAELVGKAGLYCFRKTIDELKKKHEADFVITCADGVTGGTGIGRQHAAYIRKLGSDVLTGGECCFFKKDLTENFAKMPYVLRPENYSPEAPGMGARIYKTQAEKKVAVAVLLGQSYFNRTHAESPFTRLPILLERLRGETKNVIIDFHAVTSAEKRTLLELAKGKASAVIGSHCRVQTSDEAIYEGTGFITDAGRTGSVDSIGGCEIKSRLDEYLTGIPDWTKDAWDNLETQGVILELNNDGKASSIERFKLKVAPAPQEEIKSGGGEGNRKGEKQNE